MFSKPMNGWSKFDLENFIGYVSYITDMPIEMLKCLISYKDIGAGACYFDEEGSSFTIVLSNCDVCIIEKRDEAKLHILNISPKEFALEFLKDLDVYKDDWLTWDAYDEFITEKEKQHHKEHFEELFNIVNKWVNPEEDDRYIYFKNFH